MSFEYVPIKDLRFNLTGLASLVGNYGITIYKINCSILHGNRGEGAVAEKYNLAFKRQLTESQAYLYGKDICVWQMDSIEQMVPHFKDITKGKNKAKSLGFDENFVIQKVIQFNALIDTNNMDLEPSVNHVIYVRDYLLQHPDVISLFKSRIN